MSSDVLGRLFFLLTQVLLTNRCFLNENIFHFQNYIKADFMTWMKAFFGARNLGIFEDVTQN